ncbi:hypothetical protein PPSIR1_01057 [Plesiocystis pacifica SIR-1]|uniref:Uncharacterized protein n=1 Tax=Plesiocystis pacifica SIR-1 TaxID=391625 RepID=A6GFK7_9BACT|nr:hypothetical protein [Plesiocystis pacifica]EDM75321.1 hypothetical protein PPSIR1_01057 [Plesiocystis pacifica SIR-1]
MTESYDDLLDGAREWLGTTSPALGAPEAMLAELEAHQRRRGRLRLLAALLSCLVLAAYAVSVLAHPLGASTCDWVSPGAVLRYGLVHVAGFVLASALVASTRTWAQLLVRACWWSSLLAASVGLWTELGTLPLLMPTLLLASAIGLWSLGELPLDVDAPDGGFPLIRHRELVVAMLVFAVADAETLLASALNHDEPGSLGYALTDLACALTMIVAIVGLYRLRVWGFVAVVLANLAIAGLALGGLLNYDPGFSAAFAVTAVIQVGLGVPLMRALWGGQTRLRAPSLRWPRWGARVLLVAAVGLGALATWRGLQPEVLEHHCADT